MKKLVSLTVLAGLLTGFTQAAVLANWGAAGVVTISDSASDNSSGGLATDILSVKFVTEGNTNYFLMTIAAAPSITTFSEAYMLNFDYTPGGANSSASYYIASGLTGIDELIDAHYFQNVLVSRHDHEFIGGADPQFDTQNQSPLGILYNTDGTGTQLEWAVPGGVLPNGVMTVFGSTINPSVGGKTTYDTTNGLAITIVPEPSSIALWVMGAAALGLRRRRA
ncbi:MAG: PEP-CTERM sorting domain-containing protein [Verrucomicrobia bacterium]|nr:PEP-CTERM sorting domain-containing protein [Verrucomicrobiota bacterium]